jgi:hypothetical protein
LFGVPTFFRYQGFWYANDFLLAFLSLSLMGMCTNPKTDKFHNGIVRRTDSSMRGTYPLVRFKGEYQVFPSKCMVQLLNGGHLLVRQSSDTVDLIFTRKKAFYWNDRTSLPYLPKFDKTMFAFTELLNPIELFKRLCL